MATVPEMQADVRRLASKALEIATDKDLGADEKRKRLEGEDGKGGLNADLKAAQKVLDDRAYVDEAVKAANVALGNDGSEPTKTEKSTKGAGETDQRGAIERFLDSDGYKAAKSTGFKGQNWSTGLVDTKATLTEGTSGSPGGAFGPVATPTVLPGVTQQLFRPLTVMDLFPVYGVGEGYNMVRYLVESSVTFNAAATAEGGTYPEDALNLTFVDERLGKITTSLPLSDEALEDITFLRGYAQGRLSLDIALAEEAETLSGSGTAPHINGLLNRSGLNATFAQDGATANSAGTTSPTTDTAADAIYRMLTQIRHTAFVEPDAILLNSLTWQSIRLTKDTNGQYYAGGPFGDLYGSTIGQPAGILWGKRVVVSELIANGTAIVGSFGNCAAVLRKGGVSLEATNSHGTDFLSGIQRIRAEERLGLMVPRPQGFGIVTGLV